MATKKKSKGKKGRRKISSAKVKENLDKKQFKHPYLTLPDGMDFFKAEFEKGKTTRTYKLNILPFEAGPHNRESDEGELWWRTKYDAAKNVGPEEVTIASPRSIGKKCPVYDAWRTMSDDEDIDDDDIKDLRPKSREMFYVQDATEDDGPIFLLDISYFLFGKKLDEELRSEDGEDYLAFADAEDGCTVKMRFKENKFGKATYQEVDKIDFVKRIGPEVTDEMIDGLVDPMNFITFLSVPEIKKIMEGDEDEEVPMDFDEDGKAKPTKKKKKSIGEAKKKKKAKKKKDPMAELKEQLEGMNRPALKKYIKAEEIPMKVVKSKSDEDLRNEILEHSDEADW
jgi:hypothetical protein